MSRCDEYRMEMDEIEEEIRQLELGPMDWMGDEERVPSSPAREGEGRMGAI